MQGIKPAFRVTKDFELSIIFGGERLQGGFSTNFFVGISFTTLAVEVGDKNL